VAPSQTFSAHVQEIRRRLVYIALALFIFSTLGYVFRLPIIRFLQQPIGVPLYFTTPAGSFNFVMQISMMIGFIMALPVLVYQFVRFIEPALPVRLKRWSVIKIMLASCVLAAIGAAFGFFVLIPSSLKFFMGYSSEQILPLISATDYLSYVTNTLAAFAAIFQIPLIFLFINRIKPLKPSKLLKYQRHIVVGSLGLALVLPFTYDPLTMFIIALPMIVLYYLSIILVLIVNRGKKSSPSPAPAAAFTPPIALPLPSPEPTRELLPRRRPLTMDGFNMVTTSAATRVSTPTIRKPVTHTGKRSLSIDGISPAVRFNSVAQ
jgi:sec-independent protein translocase protein TatC